MDKKTLLLHTCCGPCVTVPLERLKQEYDVTSFFYNPNIHPEEEYNQRLEEFKKLAETLEVSIVVADYNPDEWFQLVKGLEKEPERGRRCTICFQLRLEQTAQYARQAGFEYFTTTLSISPHKNASLINQLGRELAKKYNIQFLEENFKKKDGYKRSVEFSKTYNLYRQNYCGCIFSRTNQST